MRKNIFEIYRENDCKTPFYVRKNTWSKNYTLRVDKVILNEHNDYGKAWGVTIYTINTIDNYLTNNSCFFDKKDKSINNAGTFTWEKVFFIARRRL
jgi:hypothetical protein